MKKIGVLISGRGSNLQAIINAVAVGQLKAEIAVVISNRPNAAGLQYARDANIPTCTVDHKDTKAFPSREDFDRRLVSELKERGVELVCLAGFMRLLSPAFIDAFPNAILNVHPSLLPAFPGINAQYQAWEHGVQVAGATVHLVTSELDGGPIVLQDVVSVLDQDTAETLSARILEKEHALYPRAIQLLVEGKWRLAGRRFLRE
jgi:phosphoribosylglycinamide formyltransferase 1